MFSFIKDKLNKIYTHFTSKISAIFGKKTIDQETLSELEKLLIAADMGVKTTKNIIQQLNLKFSQGKIIQGQDLKEALEDILLTTLISKKEYHENDIILLVGINGSGKTTFAGKLANYYKVQQKKVLLVAGDTFRAAATDQLNQWAKKTDTPIEIGNSNQDPASVVFSGCQRFKNENFDILIIDTAGRLQAKVNLMKELEKIKKVIQKQLPEKNVSSLLVIDSMLGQNSFDQAKVFNESTNLNGLVITKMDATGKAGIAFAIVQELNIPIAYISFGEEIDKMKKFDAKEYITQLLSE